MSFYHPAIDDGAAGTSGCSGGHGKRRLIFCKQLQFVQKFCVFSVQGSRREPYHSMGCKAGKALCLI